MLCQIGGDVAALIARLVEGLIGARWLVVAFSVIALLACAAGGLNLRFSNDTRVFFAPDDPTLQTLANFERAFGQGQNVLIAIAPKERPTQGRAAFTPEAFAAAARLAEAARALPGITRVDSPGDYLVPSFDGDRLTLTPLIADASHLDQAAALAAGEAARAEPLLRGRLVAVTGNVIAVNLNAVVADDQAVATLVGEVRKTLANLATAYPTLQFHATGALIGSHAFAEATERDLAVLSPIMVALVVVLLVVLLRSFSGMAASLAVVGCAVISAMGIAGWMGLSLNPASAAAPTIILTVSIGDSVHIVSAVRRAMARGLDKRAAIAEALSVNLWPVMLTSVTTAAGFLAMNTTPSPPLRELGNLTAIGVILALLFSLTLLPALLTILPLAPARFADKEARLFRGLGRLLVGHRRLALAGGIALVAGFGPGLGLIEFDDQFTKYFDQRYEFRRATDFVEANLTGSEVIEHAVPAGAPLAALDDEHLVLLQRFAGWYRSQVGVLHVASLADVVSRVTQADLGGEASSYMVPSYDPGRARKLLMAYADALPAGAPASDLIDSTASTSRLSVIVTGLGSRDLRDFAARAEAWLAAHAPPSVSAPATGLSLMYARVSGQNITNMLTSSGVALGLISLLLVLMFASLRYGLITLIPNLAPAVIALGLWGYLVGQLGLASSAVVAMTLGVVVDNSIHFLSRYRRARRVLGLTPADAAVYAVESVGPALATTTAVLAAGFGVLATSGFEVNASLGALAALIIGIAFAVDLLILPALAMLIDRRDTPTGAQLAATTESLAGRSSS
jgi:hypothetical protein